MDIINLIALTDYILWSIKYNKSALILNSLRTKGRFRVGRITRDISKRFTGGKTVTLDQVCGVRIKISTQSFKLPPEKCS
jgi:hypothetical protein